MSERTDSTPRPQWNSLAADLRTRSGSAQAFRAVWATVEPLLDAADALYAIRGRIPYDHENEDANGWGRVDDAIERLAMLRD